MKARYSMSASSPGSGQMRISRSGSFSAKVSRQAFALPMRLSRSTMSSAMILSSLPPSGLDTRLIEIGDVAGGSHVAEPRAARHRERGDRGFVLGDLRHDRLLRAVEDAPVGGDEVLRVTQAGEIAVDFRHDVTGHQVPAAHRVFRVGPVVHETYEGTEAAADLEQGFDPSDEIVRSADRRRGAFGTRGLVKSLVGVA